jgi:CRP-like cAMP-binding protein
MDKKNALQFFSKTLDIEGTRDFIKKIDSISSLIEKKKKEIIFLENDIGTNLYFLLSGSIKLYKTNDEGKEAVIHFVEPGEFFAEIVLFLKNRYPVSAICIKSSTLLAIDAKKMYELIDKNPDFAMKLIGTFAHRMSYMSDIIKNLSIMDTKEKFLNYLDTIKRPDGTIELTIPKQEIALLLGITPETFSRVLKQLSNQGIIETDGKIIKLIR